MPNINITVREARLDINNETNYSNMTIIFENDEQKNEALNSLLCKFIEKEE